MDQKVGVESGSGTHRGGMPPVTSAGRRRGAGPRRGTATIRGRRNSNRLATAVSICLALCAWSTAGAQPLLDPAAIPMYVRPLVIPPAMPKTATITGQGGPIDYYEIAVRQFQQQILPTGLPTTTVWSYGSVNHPGHLQLPRLHHRGRGRPAGPGEVDQRPGGRRSATSCPTSCRSIRRSTGPTRPAALPAAIHARCSRAPRSVHRPGPDRDPPARRAQRAGERRLPRGLVPARREQHPRGLRHARAPGTSSSSSEFESKFGVAWEPGTATFQYDERPARRHALVSRPHPRHDPAERLRRPGRLLPPSRRDPATSRPRVLPGPGARRRGRPLRDKYYEIPLAIQDRSFNADGSLFYPDSRDVLRRLRRVRTSRAATCRRSGTRSSSATPWWSTAAPGRSWRSSRAATASGS